jgi:hypothetical protein
MGRTLPATFVAGHSHCDFSMLQSLGDHQQLHTGDWRKQFCISGEPDAHRSNMGATSAEYTRAVGLQRYANSAAKSLIYQTGEDVHESGKKCSNFTGCVSDAALVSQQHAHSILHCKHALVARRLNPWSRSCSSFVHNLDIADRPNSKGETPYATFESSEDCKYPTTFVMRSKGHAGADKVCTALSAPPMPWRSRHQQQTLSVCCTRLAGMQRVAAMALRPSGYALHTGGWAQQGLQP